MSRTEARICAAVPSTWRSLTPTCSTPIAAQLSPTVCRQRKAIGVSWKIRPSRPITNWAQVPGRSPSSGSAAFEAKVLHVAETESFAVQCWTIVRGVIVGVVRP